MAIVVIAAGCWVYPYWAAYHVTRVACVSSNVLTPTSLKPYQSQWIRSERELHALMNRVVASMVREEGTRGEDWREYCDRLVEDVRSLNPDFETESVVLVPTPGHSSSTRGSLSYPSLRSGCLVCNHTVTRSAGVMLTDINYGCWAVVVRNDSVSEVDVWIGGKRRDHLVANP
jgi:hypothetical protein